MISFADTDAPVRRRAVPVPAGGLNAFLAALTALRPSERAAYVGALSGAERRELRLAVLVDEAADEGVRRRLSRMLSGT
ncbi:hypothetical protein [Roseisolibacter sp. H3M3-2]|uniref:hypothetical protein n=1 Tax=Roseisolibacter sp. H3M3-2 TaxID=3031323 RepID=UPI0023DA57CE|nr:hypothetical protein [Roseisolibacter sp. H3M3-2]MDF1506336.1 hypothetical protein [Roseisolibacter sp. H3M3-2]